MKCSFFIIFLTAVFFCFLPKAFSEEATSIIKTETTSTTAEKSESTHATIHEEVASNPSEEKKEKDGDVALDWERVKPKQPTPPELPKKDSDNKDQEDEDSNIEDECSDGCEDSIIEE